jgi:hypothetical protein
MLLSRSFKHPNSPKKAAWLKKAVVQMVHFGGCGLLYPVTCKRSQLLQAPCTHTTGLKAAS